MISRSGKAAGLVISGALALSACGSDTQTADPASSASPGASAAAVDCGTGDLKGAGSSFAKNIVAQWIKDYTAACTGATIDYQGVGSGTGIKQFTAGTVDFAGSDAVLKDSEQADATKRCGAPAVHLPVTAGGVAVAYKLNGVTDLQLSPKTLAGIFQGTITTWDAAEIKADNASATLPSTKITAVRRSDSSGTTDIFTKFLEATAASDWKLGSGKEVDFPAAVQGAAKSDGVTQAVSGTEGAITYVEQSFVTGANLSAAKVQNSDGEFTALEAATVSKALEGVSVPTGDLTLKIDYAALGAGTYPLTGVTYAVVCSKGTDAAKLDVLKKFLTYSATGGQAAAEGLDYAPLPATLATAVTTAIGALA